MSSFNPDACPAFEPCYQPEDCWDAYLVDASPENGGTCTSCCWKLMWGMLCSGIALIAYGDLSAQRASVGDLIRRYVRKVRQYRQDVLWYRAKYPKHTPEQMEAGLQNLKDRKTDIFTTTNRKARLFSNFVRDLSDPRVQIPESPLGREYAPKQYSCGSYSFSAFGIFRNLGHILSTKYIYAIIWSSLGWGLFGSGISTYIWLQMSHGEFCVEQGYYEFDYMSMRSERYTEIYTRLRFDYLYLTLFILSGYVVFVAARWRAWLQNCHDLQHSLHAIAMLCGGGIKNPSLFPGEQSEQDIAVMRYKLHKIYRYLNCIHAMTYLTVSPTLQSLSVKETLHDKLGLLTREEVDEVGSGAHDIPRAVVLSWLTSNVMELLEGSPRRLAYVYSPAYSQLAPLRKACAEHENFQVVNQPNFYRDVVMVAMTLFMAMIIFGEPFGSNVYVGRDTTNSADIFLPCFQPMVIYAIFVLCTAVRVLFLSIMVLNNPFEYQTETINVDHLLAFSEREIFFHLRSNFGRSLSMTPMETTHTMRGSFSTFAEETRHSSMMNQQKKKKQEYDIDDSETSQTRSETSVTDRNYVSFADDLFLDTNHSRPSKGGRISDASFTPEELLRTPNDHNSFTPSTSSSSGGRISDASFSAEELLRMNTDHNRGRVSPVPFSSHHGRTSDGSKVSFAPEELLWQGPSNPPSTTSTSLQRSLTPRINNMSSFPESTPSDHYYKPRISDTSFSPEELLRMNASKVSFAPEESLAVSMHSSRVTFADDLESEPLTERAKRRKRQAERNAAAGMVPGVMNFVRSLSDDSRDSNKGRRRTSLLRESHC